MPNRIEELNQGLQEPNTGLPIINIVESQRLIKDVFTSSYADLGYELVLPDTLIPQEDDSVIFTGATITPLKRRLLEGVDSPGYFMLQNCLRTNSLKKLTDLDFIPDWTGYFTMAGVLASPGRMHEVVNEGVSLFNKLGLSGENMQVLASSSDRDLSDPWKDAGIEVAEDTQGLEYYRWKYGLENIGGRGITFLLRSELGDSFRELGNLISIETDQGEVKGYEFGFGLESLLSKMAGHKKPMTVSTMCSVIPYEEGIKEKLIDALATSTVIFHHGINPGKGKEKHVLKKLVKGLSYLRRNLQISIDDIKTYSNSFEEVEFSESTDVGERLTQAILEYEARLSKFRDYASNQQHSHLLRGETGHRLTAKIVQEGQNQGILPVEIENILLSLGISTLS